MASAVDQLQGMAQVVGVINDLRGKSGKQTTTSSGSQTTQSNMTQEGMDRILNQILAGPGGVRDVSGAARGAGLYNATTEVQMLNDLAARASGELEARRAGQTTTTDQTQTTEIEMPGAGLGGIGATLGLSALGRPLLGGLSSMIEGKGFREGAGWLGKLLGGSETAAAPALAGIDVSGIPGIDAAVRGTGVLGTPGGASLAGSGGLGSAGLGFALGGGGSAGNVLSGLTSSSMDLSNIVASPALDLGAGLGAIGDFASAPASFSLSGIPGVGSFLGGLISGGDPSDIGPGGMFASILPGLAAGGPVGALMGVAMSVLGSALGGVSIVCTALQEQGLLDKEEYAKGQAYLQTLNPHTKAGYYTLFSKAASEIRRGNKYWTAICKPFAVQRTKLIAEGKGAARWIKYPLGTLTKVIGEPICWVVGKFQAAKEAGKLQKALSV